MPDTPATAVRAVDGPRPRRAEPTPQDAVPELAEAGRARLALQLLDGSAGTPPDDDGSMPGAGAGPAAEAGSGGDAGGAGGGSGGSASGGGSGGSASGGGSGGSASGGGSGGSASGGGSGGSASGGGSGGSASGGGSAAAATGGGAGAPGPRAETPSARDGSRRVAGTDLLALQRFAGNRAVAGVAPRRRNGAPLAVQRAPGATTTEGDIQTSGVPANDPRVAEPIDPVALEVAAGGLDEAAGMIASGISGNLGEHVIIGLQPALLIVYDKGGHRISPRITLKMPQGVRPAPGVYVIPPGGGVSRRVMVDPKTLDWSMGDIAGMLMETKKKPGAGATPGAPATPPATTPPTGGTGPTDATAAGPAGPAGPTVYDLRKFMGDQSALDAALVGREKAAQWFVVPTHSGSNSKGKGDKATSGFVGELSEGGDGPAPNRPPWPVRLEGPKMVPTNATGTWDAKINWGANGNNDMLSQVVSIVGTDIHYRWEVFDITAFAAKHEAAIATQARQTQAMIARAEGKGVLPGGGAPAGDAVPGPAADAGGGAPGAGGEPTGDSGDSAKLGVDDGYDEKIDDLTRSKKGSGTEVTGREAADKAFKDDFKNLWKDTTRAAKDLRDRKGDTMGERQSNAQANLIALEMLPVSALVTAVGASLRWFADLFAGERKQMDIPWDREGTFLVRVVTTPRVSSDKDGNPVIRPSSVASSIVQVVKTERMVNEALDAPAADAQEAATALAKAMAEKTPDEDRIKKLKLEAELAELRSTGDPLKLIEAQIRIKEQDLVEVKKKWEGHAVGPILTVERELETLRNRKEVYELQERRRTGGDATIAPPTRLNATLISEVTGQRYPLLLSAGPMAMDGTRHHWKVLDATSEDSEGYDGYGATESAALESALNKFGGKAQFGRGTIGVRVPAGMALEKGARREFRIESQPTGWAIAKGRIDDLVMTLAAIGLFVSTAGTAAAVIGAAVAAARLIERLHNGTLRFDAGVVSDVLAIIGGVGVIAAEASALLRARRMGDLFVIMEEGTADAAQIERATQAIKTASSLAKGVEIANEVINYGGLVWGNVTFLNDMMQTAADEASGAITHSEARRRRAMAIGGAVNNNGMFIAGNVMKAKERAKAAAKGGGAEPAGGTGSGGEHEGGTPKPDGSTTGETTKPTEVTKPGDTVPGETTAPKEGTGTGEKGAPGETATPKEGGGTTGEPAGKTGTGGGHGTGTAEPVGTGGKAGTGGAGEHVGQGGHGGPGTGAKEPTPKQRAAASRKALTDAAKGTGGDLKQAAKDAIGSGTWKGDLKEALHGLEPAQRAVAEKALVEARDQLVTDTWNEIAKDYPDLWLENAGTRSFGSDIDATVRPKTEATGTGADMGTQVKQAAEAAQKLSDALRGKVGGETDAKIDTNIYSFIGEGRVNASDSAGKGAQQHVDLVVGLAEQMRGQSDAQFKAFEKRLQTAAADPRVQAEAKALLAEARAFHDARQAEWAEAKAAAKKANPKDSPAAIERAAREQLLAAKKAELGGLVASPDPDHAAITAKQSEINWFAPDAYATPSAFKQAVAHGQRLKGTGRTAAEMTGTEVAGKLRDAAGKLPADSPRAKQLARDAARVESQQRLLDMTNAELRAETQKSPMDGPRVDELQARADGLREAIARAAEPIIIGDLLGSTMPADKPGPERLSESAAASAANLGMLESHVAHAKDADGKIKAAAKYAGRIAMAEWLGGLRPDVTSTIGKLLGDFIQSRWGILEDVSPQVMRDMFLAYAKATGRTADIVHDANGVPVGVTDALKTRFVDDVRSWARDTNTELQAAAIGSKAFANPAEAQGGGKGTPPPAGGGDGATAGGGAKVETAPGSGETAPARDEGGATPGTGTAGKGQPGDKGSVPGDQPGVKPADEGGTPREGGTGPRSGGTTPAAGVVKEGATPILNPPGRNQAFAFRLGSLAEGHAALRQLAAGDPAVLAANGVALPAGYTPQGREFGLARMPDGSLAIVQGGIDGVRWADLPPGTERLAHTHPMTEGRELNAPGTVGAIATRTSPGGSEGTANMDRVHVFPSGGDLVYCAANGVANHDVHVPYVHMGDGVLRTPTGAPGEIPVSFNIAEARHVGNHGAFPVVEAGIVAHDAKGDILWIGRMWGIDMNGDSIISFERPAGMGPPDPATLHPDTAPATPSGTTSGGGGGDGSGPTTRREGAGGATAKDAGSTGQGGPKAGGAQDIPGGLRIENDGIATWVKSKKNPQALVRIEEAFGALLVTDIYRKDLPEGSGSVMLAEGLRALKAGPGTEIIVGEVINEPTKAAYKADADPATSKLGKTTVRALEILGLTVGSMRWEMRRGKLTIVVKVG